LDSAVRALAVGSGWLAEIRSQFSRNMLFVSMMSPPVVDAVQASMFNVIYELLLRFSAFKMFNPFAS
jgi:hypothetical protein